MSKIRKELSIIILLIMTPFLVWSQQELTGTWKYSDPGGEMIMQINKQSLYINGQEFEYNAVNNVLYVKEGNMTIEYPYTLYGDRLTLEFPGEIQLTFIRTVVGENDTRLPSRSMNNPSKPATNEVLTAGLPGKWFFQNQQGQLILEFLSDTQLSFNGEITQYRLKDGIIQAMGDFGYIDYPYNLTSGTLNITFPDGSTIPFSRISSGSSTDNSIPPGQNSSGGNLNWQLQGALCSWSGSSNLFSIIQKNFISSF